MDKKLSEIIQIDMLDNYSILDSLIKTENVYFLEPNDHIAIRPDSKFNKKKSVELIGAISFPGIYVLQSDDETISDLINRSGGLNSNSYPRGSTFTRKGKMVRIDLEEILKKPSSFKNISLQDGDQISVAIKPTVVKVNGEVSSPGFYSFNKNYRVNDYIELAGGFSPNVEQQDVFVTFPNGESKKWSRWTSNPKVHDGSVITIGKKKEDQDFDKTEYAKELTAILANVAQAISLIVLAKQQ